MRVSRSAPPYLLLFILQSTLDLGSVAAQSAFTVTVSQSPPSNAVSASANLLGISIEGCNWPDFASSNNFNSPNSFTNTVLGNLARLTGSQVSVRVGGNSEDKTSFSSSVNVESAKFPSPSSNLPYPEATAVSVSQSFYALSRFLPSGTHMTWGLNLAASNTASGLSSTISEAKAILAAFNNNANVNGVVLDLLELGNEPDLYGTNGLRPGSYNPQTYVNEWTSAMTSIKNAVGLQSGKAPAIQGMSLAHGDGNWTPQTLFNDGLLNSAAGDLITQISQHAYAGGCCSATDSDLMSKNLIRSNLTEYRDGINDVNDQGLAYVFGETNSYFNHGVPIVSDSASAAIWLVDWTLFGATIGISKFNFHHGTGYKYNFFQPVTLTRSTENAQPLNPASPPHIQMPYYGAIIVSEFLGTTGSRKIVEISIGDTTVSGYALYTSSTLRRILFIDSFAHAANTNRSFKEITVNLSGSGSTASTWTMKRLAIPSSDALKGLTWGGQSFETSSGSASGGVVTESIPRGGPVKISSTEIVMITVN